MKRLKGVNRYEAPVNATPGWTKSGDTWTYAFRGMNATTAAGIAINYTVAETPVENYETVVDGYDITNTLIPREPERTDILVGSKTWIDGDDAGGLRPDEVTVQLLRDGVVVETVTVTAADGWRYSFGEQPLDDGFGNAYAYTVRENGVLHYFTRTKGLNVYNALLMDETEIPAGDTPKGMTTRERISEQLSHMSEAELEELMELFGYGTPLWGMLGTGDETPAWPYAFAGLGALALIALAILGKKRRRAK